MPPRAATASTSRWRPAAAERVSERAFVNRPCACTVADVASSATAISDAGPIRRAAPVT
jgi:hypothetical protein